MVIDRFRMACSRGSHGTVFELAQISPRPLPKITHTVTEHQRYAGILFS